MLAFAGNSLLARGALAARAIDPVSFAAIRIAAGAAILTAVLAWRQGSGVLRRPPGSWGSAIALFAYALSFALAYLRLGAAIGTLILFAAVQGTMIVGGMMGRDHPRAIELAGLGVAFGALAYLLLPGLGAPDFLGGLLMATSGIAWGVYSLRGRRGGDPLGETSGNFLRAAAICFPLGLLQLVSGHASLPGAGLAIFSGAITSGLGYVAWYRALPGLSATQAATVQLTVPIIAAAGAMLFLSETLTARLAIASVCILGGVGLAMLAPRPGRR